MSSPPAADLARAYEAVRAQATGVASEVVPRGLALILDVGLPAWIQACPAMARTELQIASAAMTIASVPQSAELVSVLTEMALASRRRCPA